MIVNFEHGYQRIVSSVVGLGLRNDPAHRIVGSGFFIHESGWIVTNRHVIQSLQVQLGDGSFCLHPCAAAYLFPSRKVTRSMHGHEFIAAYGVVSLINSAHEPLSDRKPQVIERKQRDDGWVEQMQVLPHEGADIGMCRFNPTDIPDNFPLPKPARVVSSDSSVHEGTPVGILGFPRGLSVPVEYHARSELQFTPILQTGVVSAKLPFGDFMRPDAFILDIPVTQGSSGSPLFLPNGEVVGMVYANRQYLSHVMHLENPDTPPQPDPHRGVFIPASLGFAVPSSRFPNEWLDTSESRASAATNSETIGTKKSRRKRKPDR